MQRSAPEGDPPLGQIWPKPSSMTKTHLWDCNRACSPGMHFLGLRLGKKCADLGGRIWGPFGRAVANVLLFLAPGAISGCQKRRPVNVNIAPESKVQENRLVCSPTNGIF